MSTDYKARVLKVDLIEQDALKNEAERCSADPETLQSIGREVGHQVRITRTEKPEFFAVYTVAQPNPRADLNDPNRADVVRTGLAGRERLGASAEMDAVVSAAVVDASPAASGARFFELGQDDRTQRYVIAIAPHGGDIEEHTEGQAETLRTELGSTGYRASSWICKGFGDGTQGAGDRWHITSTDLNPASFPLLARIASRRFCYGVAFHGFSKKPGEADLYIGGRASGPLKDAIKRALDIANLPLQIRVATEGDPQKFQAASEDNLINRLAAQGVQIEQSADARKFAEPIAKAIATVYRSPTRRFLCALTNMLR
jgi:phage replication-related protein YjqB (UPF0714/DUF867 family)